MADKLRLLRNHGLATRDEITLFGHNSRLDSIQAVVAIRLLEQVHVITDKRIEVAGRYDEAFADLGEFITVPVRRPEVKQVYHTYVIRASERDSLLAYLLENGIEAKVHYPFPTP